MLLCIPAWRRWENINYCLFRAELGFAAHTLSWVTLLCTGMAGLGTSQAELMHQQQEEGGNTEEFRFLSMSVTHKQPWNLGGAAAEAAVGRSQEKISCAVWSTEPKLLAVTLAQPGCVSWNAHGVWRFGACIREPSTAGACGVLTVPVAQQTPNLWLSGSRGMSGT